ncbi:site-2 protease family protein [Nocardioides marmoraquaticus]
MTATDRGPARRAPRGAVRIGRVAGVDVLVTSSWLLVAGLIAVVLAPRIEVVQPGLGGLRYVAGVVFAVLLYLSVLLHEISHALVAQRFGLGVRSITLHFLGGATEIDRESESAKQEFWISVVGPLTSLAVGGAALALAPLSPEGLPRLAVEGLAVANLLVGVLNLVPGLPLDGGRVLRAVVWQVGGDQHRGTVAAAWGGRVVAVLVLLWPVVLELGYGVRADVLTYVVVLVLAAFLWAGATQQLAQARIRRRLPALDARRLARRALAVPDDLSVAEAVRRAQEAGAGGVVLLDRSERPAGVVSERALVATPAERRPWVPVTSVARTLEAGLLVPADLTGEELVRAMARLPAEEYVLVEPDGSIFGVLASTDVDRAFEETARS